MINLIYLLAQDKIEELNAIAGNHTGKENPSAGPIMGQFPNSSMVNRVLFHSLLKEV